MSERLLEMLGDRLYREYKTKSDKTSNVMATAIIRTNLAILDLLESFRGKTIEKPKSPEDRVLGEDEQPKEPIKKIDRKKDKKDDK